MTIQETLQNTLREIFADQNIVYDKSQFCGGMTNYNYIMEIKGVEYVVREPGNMTHLMIDRQVERINNGIASNLGINSNCIYFDAETGIKISVYIPNSRNIALANPAAPKNLTAISGLLQKLHTSSNHFPNTFDWTDELYKYEQIVEQMNGELFFDYQLLKSQLMNFLQQQITDISIVPCHNDTVPENFVMDDCARIYLIDWEYSGMNDACWDIAAYILESRLDSEAIDCFLDAYFQQPLQPQQQVKIKGYMMAQDLLWTVWALIRHYSGEDYLDYCSMRYDRFRKNIKKIMEPTGISIADMVTV